MKSQWERCEQENLTFHWKGAPWLLGGELVRGRHGRKKPTDQLGGCPNHSGDNDAVDLVVAVEMVRGGQILEMDDRTGS